MGTINRIRREIPNEVKSVKTPLHSTIILRYKNTTLTVYQGKPSKNVLLLSTVHKTVSCSKKKTSEAIEYNNATKYGDDVLNQKARMYIIKVSSRRWVKVFYNVLDLAVINSVIVYNEVANDKITRRDYLLKLIRKLSNVWRPNKSDEESETEQNPASFYLTTNSFDKP